MKATIPFSVRFGMPTKSLQCNSLYNITKAKVSWQAEILILGVHQQVKREKMQKIVEVYFDPPHCLALALQPKT